MERGTRRVSNSIYLLIGILAMVLLAMLTIGLLFGSLPAVVVSGVGIALTIMAASPMLLATDEQRSRATERTLRMASAAQYHMRGGLTEEGCRAVCHLLLPETDAVAIAMTDTYQTLALVGEGIDGLEGIGEGELNTPATTEVLQSGHIETFSNLKDEGWRREDSLRGGLLPEGMRVYPVGIIVPLTVSERTVGTLKLYYHNASAVNRTQLAIARGLAELLSAQLSVYELDRQAELTARAEVKALQAQINPHFLFNTLNTIASLTRTDPTRARDLLREFAVFYRRTLEGTEAPILLSEELEQTRRYLTIEQARFGDDRIVLTEGIELGCGSIRVPAFIVQPIVENAVRHAMRDEGTLHIDVQVATDGQDVLIAVADDGLGMSEEVAERLVSDEPPQGFSTSSKGTGIALRNVADRIELFYGEGSGIEIMSKVDSGTCVTLRLVDAAPLDEPDEGDDWDFEEDEF